MERNIEVSEKRYRELISHERELFALRDAGVDNWEGYDYAMELYYEKEEKNSE